MTARFTLQKALLQLDHDQLEEGESNLRKAIDQAEGEDDITKRQTPLT